MKSSTIITQIKKNGGFTKNQIHELTLALRAEKRLSPELAIRVRPYEATLDIVNQSFLRGADMTYQYYVGSIDNLDKALKEAADEFTGEA